MAKNKSLYEMLRNIHTYDKNTFTLFNQFVI